LFCVCHVLAALHEEELAFVTGLFEGLDEVLFLCAVGFEKGHLVLYVDFSDGNFVSRCLAVDDADELIGTQVVFGADVDAVTAKLTTAVAATSAAAFTTGCSFPAGSAFSPALRAFAADYALASYAAFRSCSFGTAARASTSLRARVILFHHCSGSCSAQPVFTAVMGISSEG
jgi:hypothetical protein